MKEEQRRRSVRIPWLVIGTLAGALSGWLRERHQLRNMTVPLCFTAAGFISGLIVDFQAQRPGMTSSRLGVRILAALFGLFVVWALSVPSIWR
jgi:hypothetical protein